MNPTIATLGALMMVVFTVGAAMDGAVVAAIVAGLFALVFAISAIVCRED